MSANVHESIGTAFTMKPARARLGPMFLFLADTERTFDNPVSKVA